MPFAHSLDRRRAWGSSAETRVWASNLANSLWLEDRLAEALSWARWATRESGDSPGVHPLAWRCLGNVLLDGGQFEAAEAAYRRSDPRQQDPATQFNRSKALLGLGRFDEAWRLAERRLELVPPPDGVLAGPWWNDWKNISLLTVWSEQGLGDTIQFVRWLPLLMRHRPECRVQLLVQPPLQTLLSEALAWLGPQLQVEGHRQEKPVLSGCHGSLLSLPWRLGVASPPWPDDGPYLRLPPAAAASSARFRLGVLWGAGRYLDGHSRERDYRRKSVLGEPLRQLLQELEQRPLELWKLQVGPDRDRPEQTDIAWAGALNPQADFLGLAQQLQQLDLLLCVDTAAAHLAGAMGLEAWVLLPWAAASRWQRYSSSTAWYPSLRLWRQPRHGDWLGLWPELLAGLDQRLDAFSRRSNNAS